MIAIRNEQEIALLRQANQVVARVHEMLAPMIRPGAVTRDLDAAAEDYIRRAGATPAFKGYHGFPASTCISVDDEVVHGIPGDRVLEEGAVVSVDVGVVLNGYYGDAARTAPVGEIDPERQRLLDATDRALANAVLAARDGAYLRDIGRAVEAVCEEAGFAVVRAFVGHGIGTRMHEEPQIPNFDTGRRGPKLKTGMVLAIEPMVNMGTHKVRVLEDGWTAVTMDGKPSAHFEHTIVVRKDGGEILSGSDVCVWGRERGEATKN